MKNSFEFKVLKKKKKSQIKWDVARNEMKIFCIFIEMENLIKMEVKND